MNEGERATIRVPRLIGASETTQQLSPSRVQVVVILERDVIDDIETPLGAIRLGDGDRPAQLDDRRVGDAGKLAVEGCDLGPIPRLVGMQTASLLTRLSLAWSRDGTRKCYVQDRMREAGRELWTWIAEGAHIYVCGAIAMGRDVERALNEIVCEHGARPADQAASFLGELKKSGRYQTDVY